MKKCQYVLPFLKDSILTCTTLLKIFKWTLITFTVISFFQSVILQVVQNYQF